LDFPTKVVITEDLRFVFTTGRGNGIYRWQFYGDKAMPDDLSVQYEAMEEELEKKEVK
jgi:DUF971 family protein